MVDLGGYVIVLVEKDGKIKLFGSAAERSDCDEILEVNGSSLEKMSHEQIIQHIHECIKTRTICLRVKRRSSGKLGSSIDSSLIDAFVIGSRAREHLQTLTKDANITPKDIAQLSKILSERNGDAELSARKRLADLENKENILKSPTIRPKSEADKIEENANLRKIDSGDIDYLELNDDNIELFNIKPGPNINLKKTDSQQSIVDLVKRSASISLSNTSLNNKFIYKRQQEDEEAKKYIPFNRLNSVVDRLETSLDDSNLRRLIEKTNFKTLIDIYSTLMQERYLNASTVDLDSLQLHEEIIELLQNKGNVEDDFIELLEILTKFEYEGLFQVLNYTLKRRKNLSASPKDNVIAQQEDSRTSIREEEEHAPEDKSEENDVQSLVEESISLKEEFQDERSGHVEVESGKQEVNENVICEERSREMFEGPILTDERKSSVKSIQDDIPPVPPPLPMQILNSLNLDRQTNTSDLITTSAEIPTLSSMASITQPAISSIQPIAPKQIAQQLIRQHEITPEPSNEFIPSSPPQNVLQNTFLSSVNSSLNFVNAVDLTQTPYYTLSPIPPILAPQPDKHPNQSSLCNLDYSTSQYVATNLLPNQSTDTPICTYDLSLNNVKLGESITNQNIPNQHLTNTLPTISALEYSAGQLPPPPMISNLPPNLSNLPANTKLSIVKIQKHSSEPLGATVRNECDGRVTIGRIVCGGAASRCQALQEGDEILMVNNIYIRGKTVDQVCELLSQMQGTLTFVIAKRNSVQLANEQAKLNLQQQTANVIRKSSTSSHESSNLPNGCKVIHYKAFFDYNPIDDVYIPCRELGLSFKKGDLLHIIDSSDDCWWQSYKEGDVNQNLAGLIPSLKFQLMREEAIKKLEQQKSELKQDEQIELDSMDGTRRTTSSSILSFNCHGKRSTSKKRKNRKEEFSVPEHYVPYEEMKQSLGYKRTVVFLGPNNIGRQSLRERLLKHFNIFGTAIPHTSRTKRSDEKHGEDYYFVGKPQFEQYIEEDKFVEYGDYDKNYYGTSYSSIEDVLKSNKTCILNLHVQSIPKLRTPNTGKRFKPFFVFISPPSNLDALQKLVESINNVTVSINDLHAILNEAYEIRKNFQHYFDLILTVTDIEETYKFLLNEISTLDKEPQWVPAAWN